VNKVRSVHVNAVGGLANMERRMTLNKNLLGITLAQHLARSAVSASAAIVFPATFLAHD